MHWNSGSNSPKEFSVVRSKTEIKHSNHTWYGIKAEYDNRQGGKKKLVLQYHFISPVTLDGIPDLDKKKWHKAHLGTTFRVNKKNDVLFQPLYVDALCAVLSYLH